MPSQLNRAVAAEFLATALFVWCGCGAAIATNKWGAGQSDSSSLLTIAIGFGFAISYLAYAIGHISGGHINPAVTFAFLMLKKISPKKAALYMVAQFTGAVLGAFILWGCAASLTDSCRTGADDNLPVCDASAKSGGGYGPPWGLGANAVGPRVNLGSGFLIEGTGTFLLVFVVLMSAAHSRSEAGNAAPIAIGWAVMGAHIVLVPFTGCGINPARTFGPFLVNSIGGVSYWERGWWIYFTAPFVGAGVATLTFQYIFRLQHDTFAHKDEVEESEHPADFSQDPKSEDVEEGGEKAE